jgi:tetratricopeptide (TPR) repeat protein
MTATTEHPGSSVTRRIIQAFGAAVLAGTVWQAAVLLTVLPRYYAAPAFWLEAGVNLAVWLPCMMAPSGLLRGRPSGFLPLYALAVPLPVGGLEVQFPWLSEWLAPWDTQWYLPKQTWLVGLVLFCLLIAIHWFAARSVPARQPSPLWRSCLGVCLLAGLCLVLQFGFSFGRQRIEQEAANAEKRGYAAYMEGRREEALMEWGRVADSYPCTSAWGVATFNMGVCLREQGRQREAIARFESLLGSSVNDYEPSGYLMEAYKGYRHRACLEISSCCEEAGDREATLRYALLARDRYPYRSWCGTCMMESRRELQERIDRLELARLEGD